MQNENLIYNLKKAFYSNSKLIINDQLYNYCKLLIVKISHFVDLLVVNALSLCTIFIFNSKT